MADLTACYFCGDSTVDEYPVIPPRMDPPEDVQKTVALCPDCHERLGAVLQTVVGFLGTADGGARAGATGGGTDAGGDTDASDAADDDVWFESSGPSEGSGGAESSAGASSGGGATEAGAGASGGGAAGGGAGAAGGGAGASGDAGASGGSPATAPESYRKVLRLLQNREFPVDRAEFETVAANAYELSPGEVGAALDAAVDRGLIDEADGTLHRSG